MDGKYEIYLSLTTGISRWFRSCRHSCSPNLRKRPQFNGRDDSNHTTYLKSTLWTEEASDKRCIPGAVELVAFPFLPRMDMQRRCSVVAADKGAGLLMIFTGLYSGDFWRSMNDASLFSNTKLRTTRWRASWRYSGCLYFSSFTQW